MEDEVMVKPSEKIIKLHGSDDPRIAELMENRRSGKSQAQALILGEAIMKNPSGRYGVFVGGKMWLVTGKLSTEESSPYLNVDKGSSPYLIMDYNN